MRQGDRRADVVEGEGEKLGMKSQNQDVGKGDGGVPQELEERGAKGRMETWVEARGPGSRAGPVTLPNARGANAKAAEP